jgi:2-polyprenyl-6-methoxyphenol hydroxylase-like FAD-dependent oxidoreductase
MNPHVTILGAGLSGALMSIFLARNARKVVLYERRPDLRKVDMDAGRSINLALAARGIEALKEPACSTKSSRSSSRCAVAYCTISRESRASCRTASARTK